jgi:oligosaccharyltransferase complex subunit alpha (ribophorin I)
MRLSQILQQAAGAVVASSLLSITVAAAEPFDSHVKILPSSFTPPQVFENSNLVRNVNLEKHYPRETVNVVIKNVGKEPQSEYYYLFPSAQVGYVGGLEVRDKKDAAAGAFKVDLAQYEEPKYADWQLIDIDLLMETAQTRTT